MQRVMAGILAGGIGSAIGNPADVVLVRMQADQRRPPELRRNYRHFGDGFSRVVRDEGVMALTKVPLSSLCSSFFFFSLSLSLSFSPF